MIPVISVVGKSNVGKTTMLEKLLRELKLRGYKVATIKHDAHGFDLDVPGKDTWRHATAGADTVVISSPHKFAMIQNVTEELALEQIVARISGVDLILTEGYKHGDRPKIEVFRQGVYDELVCAADELIAIATDVKFELGIPCYDLDDAAGLVDRIEELFLRNSREG
ncbi:MAG: molybdopterin-guanine dinucleotide biosynthesis protein B [Peptococcaceae bacterium]|nr:molybdopterin-guanine dinucleotide biosynthesis protein B [Peptococcaceae bacterium]